RRSLQSARGEKRHPRHRGVAGRYRLGRHFVLKRGPPMSLPLQHPDTFVRRHIGPSVAEQKNMLETMGIASLDAPVTDTVPQSIPMSKKLDIQSGLTEAALRERANELGKKNEVWRSLQAMG